MKEKVEKVTSTALKYRSMRIKKQATKPQKRETAKRQREGKPVL